MQGAYTDDETIKGRNDQQNASMSAQWLRKKRKMVGIIKEGYPSKRNDGFQA